MIFHFILTIVGCDDFEGSFGVALLGILKNANFVLLCYIALFSIFFFITVFYIENNVGFRCGGRQMRWKIWGKFWPGSLILGRYCALIMHVLILLCGLDLYGPCLLESIFLVLTSWWPKFVVLMSPFSRFWALRCDPIFKVIMSI